MTDILSINKTGIHSSLNMLDEYSMISPRHLITPMGFTRNDVLTICQFFSMSFEAMAEWYGGYHFYDEVTVY